MKIGEGINKFGRRLRRLVGDGLAMFAVGLTLTLWVVACFGIPVGFVWVVVHFIRKFW